MSTQIIIMQVIDGAAFDNLLCEKAFLVASTAEEWAQHEVEQRREALRVKGETDSAFIEAIYSKSHNVQFEV